MVWAQTWIVRKNYAGFLFSRLQSDPFGSSILSENVIVMDGNFRVLLSQDSDTTRTSRLEECAKAVNKTNVGRRLLIVSYMKPRLLRLHKSTNECAWGMGVELGTAGPGLTIHHQRNRGGVG